MYVCICILFLMIVSVYIEAFHLQSYRFAQLIRYNHPKVKTPIHFFACHILFGFFLLFILSCFHRYTVAHIWSIVFVVFSLLTPLTYTQHTILRQKSSDIWIESIFHVNVPNIYFIVLQQRQLSLHSTHIFVIVSQRSVGGWYSLCLLNVVHLDTRRDRCDLRGIKAIELHTRYQ